MKKILLLSILIIVNACNDTTQTSSNLSETQQIYNTENENTVATFSNGNINIDELEEYIKTLPSNDRWSATNPKQWYKDIIKKLVIKKTFLDEIKIKNFMDVPLMQRKIRETERYLYTAQYLTTQQEVLEISEEDINNYFTENKHRFDLPEQRVVYHIFKENGKDLETTKNKINQIRQRVVNGENFKLLAKEFSDSESRHRSGILGNVKKGELSDDLDGVVFSLKKNTPSEIIKTKTGFHIFYVDNILDEKTYELNEVQNLLLNELTTKRSLDVIKKIAEELPSIQPNFIIDVQKSNNTALKPNSLIIKVGDFSLNYAQLNSEINNILKYNPNIKDKDFVQNYINETAYKEIIYQFMKKENIPLKNTNILNLQTEQIAIKEYRNVKLHDYVNNNPELLNEYYENNKMRFSTPVKLNLKKLSIPRKAGENLMPLLEKSVSDLDLNNISIEDLAKKLNGKIINLGTKTATELNLIDPQINNIAFLLNVNEHSAPYTNQYHYNILKLIEKEEPKLRSMTEVKNQVIAEYIKNNEAMLFNNISKDIITNVQINETLLDKLINNYKNN